MVQRNAGEGARATNSTTHHIQHDVSLRGVPPEAGRRSNLVEIDEIAALSRDEIASLRSQ